MLSSFALPEPQLKSIDIHHPNNKKKNNNKHHQQQYQNDETASVHELTNLIGRLTAQLEKLETIKAEKKSNINHNHNEQEQQQHPQQQSNFNNNSRNNSRKRIIINPLAADVTQSYDNLIQHNEYLKQSISVNHCRCCSCTATNNTSTGETSLPILPFDENSVIVEAASGIPWFSPLARNNNSSGASNEDPLQIAYTHWCTLMRCLPCLDPAAQYYIRTVGQYAMRQLLHSMQNNGTISHCSSTLTRFNNNNHNTSSRTSSMMLTTTTPSSPPPSSMQRHSYYHGSSNTLLNSKVAGIGSSQAGSSHTGSTTLLAQHSLLKTSSTCLNDMIQHHRHLSSTHTTGGSTTLCKADGWVPPPPRTTMTDNDSPYLYHSHNNNNNQRQHPTSQLQSLQPHYSRDSHTMDTTINQVPLSPPPSTSATLPHQIPVTNAESSPLPTPSHGFFSTPLLQHVARPYHATKFRRWFKRNNKVAPVANNNH